MRVFNYFILTIFLLSSTFLNKQEIEAINYAEIENNIEVINIHEELDNISNINEEIELDEDEIREEVIEEIKEELEVQITEFKSDGRVLNLGIVSEEVLRIKRFLKAKGYSDISEGYYYDNKLKEVIIDYQTKNELTPDGSIGPYSIQKINEDMKINKLNIGEIELFVEVEEPAERWIVINKDSNTLYHLNGKKIIRKYPVATGKTPQYTPEGRFSIVTKIINPAWGGAGIYTPVKGGAPNNPLGKRWMGLSLRGGGVYGIHGNADKDSIGKYASLGCIRMYNEDAEFLYELVNIGTPVWIGNETKLKEFGLIFR